MQNASRIALGFVAGTVALTGSIAHAADGTMNFVGALRRAMATTGYTGVKEFQRVEVVVQ